LSERPTVARTWAPRGHTPVIQYSFDWKQLSAIAGLTFWRFYFRFFSGTIRAAQLVEFLRALRTQLRHSGKLLIIWDGLNTHKSRLVRGWLEAQHGQVQIEFLPPYAPELNPVEQIWNYLKNREIANLCASCIAEVGHLARQRLRSMQRRPSLLRAFWQQAELAF
jgi:transposase